MKTHRIFIALLGLLGATALAHANTTLAHRYEFDNNVTDSVGTTNATATGTWEPSSLAAPTYEHYVPSGATGPTQSVQLGTTQDAVSGFSVPASAFSETGSISLWMQHNLAQTSTSDSDYILNMSTEWNRGIKLYFAGSSSNLVARVGDKAIGTQQALVQNTWYHVAITWDKTTGDASFYVNGALVANDSFTPSTLPFTGLNVGNYSFSSTYLNNQFDGSVYDLQIYDGQLAPSDISLLYANPGTVTPIPEPSSAAALLGVLSMAWVGFHRSRRR